MVEKILNKIKEDLDLGLDQSTGDEFHEIQNTIIIENLLGDKVLKFEYEGKLYLISIQELYETI